MNTYAKVCIVEGGQWCTIMLCGSDLHEIPLVVFLNRSFWENSLLAHIYIAIKIL